MSFKVALCSLRDEAPLPDDRQFNSLKCLHGFHCRLLKKTLLQLAHRLHADAAIVAGGTWMEPA